MKSQSCQIDLLMYSLNNLCIDLDLNVFLYGIPYCSHQTQIKKQVRVTTPRQITRDQTIIPGPWHLIRNAYNTLAYKWLFALVVVANPTLFTVLDLSSLLIHSPDE